MIAAIFLLLASSTSSVATSTKTYRADQAHIGLKWFDCINDRKIWTVKFENTEQVKRLFVGSVSADEDYFIEKPAKSIIVSDSKGSEVIKVIGGGALNNSSTRKGSFVLEMQTSDVSDWTATLDIKLPGKSIKFEDCRATMLAMGGNYKWYPAEGPQQ